MGKFTCGACKKSLSGEALKVQEKYYHIKCFKCKACKKNLADGGYFYKDGKYYCPDDYQVKYGKKCAKCNKYVEGEVVTILNKQYHHQCLTCSLCRKACVAGSTVVVEKDNTVICHRCNPSITAQTASTTSAAPRTLDLTDTTTNGFNLSTSFDDCSGCGESLHGKSAVLALDKKWHVECFTCKNCAQVLPGEYMGKDGWPYCEKDYQQLFGVKCVACEEYITGKVLQAGDKHFHPECSRCAKCHMMFGEGEEMYLQGTDIWHPACTEVMDGDTSQQYAVPYTPDRYEPKYDPDFSGEIYIASYLPLPERFDGYMRMPISPRPPSSPHFHRPGGLFSYRQQKQRFLVNPHRSGLQAMVDTLEVEQPRVKSPHMNNEEPIELAHYPNGRPPSPGEKRPIEREDFPAPPYLPFGLLKWHRGGADDFDDFEEDIFKKEKELLKKEEEQLEKVRSGVGNIILKEIKRDIKKAEERTLDPRNASRTASARREPHLPPRYESPIFASPSRHMNRPTPWRRDHGVIDRYGTYRSYMGIIPTYGVPKPGYGLTPKSATLPGGVAYRDHDISFDSMNSTRSSDYNRTVTSMDSSASYVNGLPPNMQFASHRHYQKYPNAPHHRRSLPNVSSEPPKVYAFDQLKTTNYKLPEDVDRTHLERHLELAEFRQSFKMTPIEFYKLPLWKRNELKKGKKLF